MFTICLVLAAAVLVLSFLLYVLQAAWEDVAADLRQQLAAERAKHAPPTATVRADVKGRLQVGPAVDPARLAREATGRV